MAAKKKAVKASKTKKNPVGRPLKGKIHRRHSHRITSFHLKADLYTKFVKKVKAAGYTISETVEKLMEGYIKGK